MGRAHFCLLLSAFCLACAQEPPKFPTHAPAQVAQYATGRERGPAPEGESRGVTFAMPPETRTAITLVASCGAAAFLVVFLAAFFWARDALVPAGIAAALFGPVAAIAISVRRIPEILMRPHLHETAFASMSFDVWNLTQPLLYALFVAAGCLIVLTTVAGLTRRPVVGRTLMTILPLLVFIAAAVAFVCYADVSRTVIGIMDPDHTFRATSIADVARSTAILITTAYGVSLFTTLLIPVTVVLSFVVRQKPHFAVMIVLVALILTGAAAYFEYSWCAALEVAARTGHLPNFFWRAR